MKKNKHIGSSFDDFLQEQHIIQCLNTNYGIKVAALTFIPLGADMDASVYKAQTYDQSSYFVKLKRGCHQDIGTIMQLLLHDNGIKQIIYPIKTNHGQPTCHIDDFTITAYPFIEGKNGFNIDLTNGQWITLGKALKEVHEFHLPSSIKDQIKLESYSPKWREAVRSMYTYIDTEQRVTDEIALKLLTFMKEHRATIQRLVNRADQLEQKIQKQSPEFVLCHSDIHAGNVLIANDGNIYIVDWDQPIMAPKERDLMFIGGGIANVWNNPHEEKLFYKGYGKTEINKKILAYYRHERIVEDIAIYSQQLLLATNGGKDREIMYKQFIDMFESRGVVDIAFKTDTDL
ncbi:MAG: spectinomycin phosphotransferase [Epsilonproteobacteria bacterium]|nr:spectinomycin phosphotransferase [Campylobacterota bacterium]|tara:strand:- start:6483 stop:7517 length:1035 start_codon:yes stop_codon:yes gene_type:complete